jgi:hypothetical protein
MVGAYEIRGVCDMGRGVCDMGCMMWDGAYAIRPYHTRGVGM